LLDCLHEFLLKVPSETKSQIEALEKAITEMEKEAKDIYYAHDKEYFPQDFSIVKKKQRPQQSWIHMNLRECSQAGYWKIL